MKSFVTIALLTASVATAAPAACNAPQSFKLAAQPLNNTAKKTYLQAYDNAGSDSYQFLFGAGASADGASAFTFDLSTGRIDTSIQSNTGSTLYKSLAPSVNQLLNLTTSQSDPSGSLAIDCSQTGVQYLVETAKVGTHPTAPWLLCQIPGWTTGLTQIYYNPVNDTTGIDNHEGGSYPCTRVGLSLN